MIVRVDQLRVIEFGRAVPQPNQPRFYYQVIGYDCLILRCDLKPFDETIGQIKVALFNFDTIDGRKICQAFPKAPARWQDDTDLVQCSLREFDATGRRGPKALLSAAIKQHLGESC